MGVARLRVQPTCGPEIDPDRMHATVRDRCRKANRCDLHAPELRRLVQRNDDGRGAPVGSGDALIAVTAQWHGRSRRGPGSRRRWPGRRGRGRAAGRCVRPARAGVRRAGGRRLRGARCCRGRRGRARRRRRRRGGRVGRRAAGSLLRADGPGVSGQLARVGGPDRQVDGEDHSEGDGQHDRRHPDAEHGHECPLGASTSTAGVLLMPSRRRASATRARSSRPTSNCRPGWVRATTRRLI